MTFEEWSAKYHDSPWGNEQHVAEAAWQAGHLEGVLETLADYEAVQARKDKPEENENS